MAHGSSLLVTLLQGAAVLVPVALPRLVWSRVQQRRLSFLLLQGPHDGGL
jgi:hypothetical protein